MRIAVLWTRESGYLAATLRSAAARGHVVILFSQGTSPAAPFSDESMTMPGEIIRNASYVEIIERLSGHEPDILVIGGWMLKSYMSIAKRYRGRAMRILAMDNQWGGTVRQRAGQLAFRTTWQSHFDAVLVPGARQRIFARKLGFSAPTIFEGTYSADVQLFGQRARLPEKYFLYVGRNSAEKNLKTLAAAYRQYQISTNEPWKLVLAGAREFDDFDGQAGVEVLGFVDPPALADIMGSAGAFVLPSYHEPWGVVVHEAAAAGRFIIVSSACGSSDSFVLNGINGLIFEADNVAMLRNALVHASSLELDDLAGRSAISTSLAQRFDSSSWSQSVEAAFMRFQASKQAPNYSMNGRSSAQIS